MANDCCQKPENLKVITPDEAGQSPREGVVIKRCTVCGCRHFEATIDPFAMGVTGAPLK